MRKFLKRAFIFSSCLCSFIILLLLAQETELIVGRKKIYLEKYSKRDYDLLVIGSSRAEHTFNPMIYKGSLRMFNAGEEGHGLPSNYLELKVLVEKYHVKVDKLLFQIDEFSFDGINGFSRQFRDDFFVTDLDDPEVLDAFIRYRGATIAYTVKYFPRSANLIYADFYKFLKNQTLSLKKWVPALNDIYVSHIKQLTKFKGYKPLMARKLVTARPQLLNIQDDDLEYFKKLTRFCLANNIQLYFYRAPILKCGLVNSVPFDNYIREFSASNNLPFYDYKCKYQWPDQYEDQNHSADSIGSIMTRDLLRDMGLMGN